MSCCILITVAGRPARIASFLPVRGWSLHNKGYLIYTSRSKSSGIRRGARAHVLAVEHGLEERIDHGSNVHHQDFDKLNCCPTNLVYCVQAVFNGHCGWYRDPYTGVWLTPDDYIRRYSMLHTIRGTADTCEVPDWVTPDWVTHDLADLGGGAEVYID